MKKQVILDTGPLIALLNRHDVYHNWVTHQIKSINPPLLSSEAVITEACFLSCRDIGETNAVIDLALNGFDDSQPVNIREHTVNHHHIVIFTHRHKKPVLAIRGMINSVSIFFQPFDEIGNDFGIVFDNQDTHISFQLEVLV